MRHLLALFALAFALVACDDTATTAPTDTIPGPNENPRLEVTVLTGTKAAPVDSPTVKVQWWYNGDLRIAGGGINNSMNVTVGPQVLMLEKKSSGDTTVKVGCAGLSELLYVFQAVGTGPGGTIDTSRVYCKAP